MTFYSGGTIKDRNVFVRVQYFNSFYFNVCNQDLGEWSTKWIIDDPTVFALNGN